MFIFRLVLYFRYRFNADPTFGKRVLCYLFVLKKFSSSLREFSKKCILGSLFIFSMKRSVQFAIKVDYFVARCLLVTFHFKENGAKIGLFLFEATCTICERIDFS